MGMRHTYIFLIAAAVFMLCTPLCTFAGQEEESHVLDVLDSYKETKKLDGTKLKIARPFLKRTPMGVIVDEINMLVICPMDTTGANEDQISAVKAVQSLKGYTMVREIDDEKSTMTIYIDTPQDNRFSEIILYNTKPEASIMLFKGDFTVESLIKDGEASKQERKHLKKNK